MADEVIKVSIYINEADQWNHRPLHLELLRMLHEQGIAGGTVLRAVAGFTHHGRVEGISSCNLCFGIRLYLFLCSLYGVERELRLGRSLRFKCG